jgi:hypothetical protein
MAATRAAFLFFKGGEPMGFYYEFETMKQARDFAEELKRLLYTSWNTHPAHPTSPEHIVRVHETTEYEPTVYVERPENIPLWQLACLPTTSKKMKKRMERMARKAEDMVDQLANTFGGGNTGT